MTTRSGARYKESEREMSDGETGETYTTELVRVLTQERKRRELEEQRKYMQEQMDLLMKLVQEQARSATPGNATVTVERDVKFTKLTEAA